jgi:hypothetical protein
VLVGHHEIIRSGLAAHHGREYAAGGAMRSEEIASAIAGFVRR